ncbi:hypothetical protein PENFLA_c001G06763 [Penicillium flavigenum]|uniref:Fungal N-terminal domain-containing protein n=1 Tax=Penicillium flavigenum TaxID=254877 RepID=A0A1V6U360_9EURO|nr:hypothetical protein PENFLA_c001G06763 [Penicillium flavigenum]
MSGLEVVGVVASIIQIADLGAKLSVKLCTFYKTVKVANKSMQELSSDVSLTCSILNELGKTLEQDDQTRLCSKQAFSTAQEVLQECKSVFEEFDTAIEKHSQDNEKNRLTRHARKITIALLGPDLDVLKSNLERLKSTALLMLHVIMYAGQLRKANEKSTMADQRGLIQTLLEEKIANDAKHNTLSKSIQAVSIPKDDSAFQPSVKALSIDPQPTPPTPLWNEVGEYYNLVRGLLCQIDAYQDILEKSRHLRIRNGVINVHSAESVLFQHIHGQAANQLFDDPIFRFRDASFPATHQIHTRSDSPDETAKRGKTRAEPSHSSDSEYEPKREKTGKSYVHRERRRDRDRTRAIVRSCITPSEDNLSNSTSYEVSCHTAPALHKRRSISRGLRLPTTISRYEREVGDEPLARRYSDERDYYELPYVYTNSHESEFEVRRAEAENAYRRSSHRRDHSHFDHGSWPDPRPDDSIAQAPQRCPDRDQGHSSGDSKIYIDKNTRYYDDYPHHRRPIAEGSLVYAGMTESLGSHRKEDEEASHDAAKAPSKPMPRAVARRKPLESKSSFWSYPTSRLNKPTEAPVTPSKPGGSQTSSLDRPHVAASPRRGLAEFYKRKKDPNVKEQAARESLVSESRLPPVGGGKKGADDQLMLEPPPPQPIESSSDDGDYDDDIFIIDEVNKLIGEPIESKEENWDSSSYVSSDAAPDIITLESLVLQWTTLKPEELQV